MAMFSSRMPVSKENCLNFSFKSSVISAVRPVIMTHSRVRSAYICEKHFIYTVCKASSYCKVCWEPQTHLPWSWWCERPRSRQIWRQPRACHCHLPNLIKSNTFSPKEQSTMRKNNLTKSKSRNTYAGCGRQNVLESRFSWRGATSSSRNRHS